MTDEANERHDIVGHSVIRPGCVVEMSHCHVLGVCLCQLQFRVWTQREEGGEEMSDGGCEIKE